MPITPRQNPRVRLLARLFTLLAISSCGMGDEPRRLHTTHAAPIPSGSITVVPRQALLPTFPCSRCHDTLTPNPTERPLVEFHSQKVLDHGPQNGWCYRCHTKDNFDELHLQDGTLVSFDEAYRLCGSCHGDKLRDWNAGLHGLTTGYWLGARERRSCPACHDPHKPRFPLMTPEHPPALPRTVSPSDRAHKAEESHGDE